MADDEERMNDRLLTSREVAELLAVPRTWVEEHARAGNIPHRRLGRYVRYDRAEVLAWLEGCSVPGRRVAFRKHAPRAA